MLEFKSEDFPVIVRLRLPEGTREYVLVKTKQGKLLLNKPVEVAKDTNPREVHRLHAPSSFAHDTAFDQA